MFWWNCKRWIIISILLTHCSFHFKQQKISCKEIFSPITLRFCCEFFPRISLLHLLTAWNSSVNPVPGYCLEELINTLTLALCLTAELPVLTLHHNLHWIWWEMMGDFLDGRILVIYFYWRLFFLFISSLGKNLDSGQLKSNHHLDHGDYHVKNIFCCYLVNLICY